MADDVYEMMARHYLTTNWKQSTEDGCKWEDRGDFCPHDLATFARQIAVRTLATLGLTDIDAEARRYRKEGNSAAADVGDSIGLMLRRRAEEIRHG